MMTLSLSYGIDTAFSSREKQLAIAGREMSDEWSRSASAVVVRRGSGAPHHFLCWSPGRYQTDRRGWGQINALDRLVADLSEPAHVCRERVDRDRSIVGIKRSGKDKP